MKSKLGALSLVFLIIMLGMRFAAAAQSETLDRSVLPIPEPTAPV
jgi:hypothetical protein